MKERSVKSSKKLPYRDRVKIKVTNQETRVKAKISEKEEEHSVEWKAQLIQQLIPVGLRALQELLESEVTRLAGERYSRGEGCSRWGTNPGWVYLGDQKTKMTVPRVREKDGGEEVPLESYQAMQNPRQLEDVTLRRIIGGLSHRKYEKAVIAVPETFGIKSSSVSRRFVRASAKKLKDFMERDLSSYDIVSIVLDGKSFGQNQFVIALGVTMQGEKILLGFIEARTENHRICRDFLQQLIDRGLRLDNEILFVIDGAKGLRKGIYDVFGKQGIVQRCQWHKRENVLSYLGKADQEEYRRKMQAAYEQPTYQKVKGRLLSIHRELDKINVSAANSLMEGFEETLTIHRLKLFPELGISFKTTNMLENINSLLEMTTGRVSYWQSSQHRRRWIATALLEIEPRLRPIKGCRFLLALRDAMKREVNSVHFKQLQCAA